MCQRPEVEEVDGRIRSAGVIAVLARLVSKRSAPLYLRSDNGPEFVSRALLKWIIDQGIATALIDPGKLWQNGTGESFNGKFRDECLSLEWFRSRAEPGLGTSIVEALAQQLDARVAASMTSHGTSVCITKNVRISTSGSCLAGRRPCPPALRGKCRARNPRCDRRRAGEIYPTIARH